MATCTVTCTIYDQSGSPEAGAIVRAVLMGRDGGTAPDATSRVVGYTNSSGQCTLALLRGVVPAPEYEITITGERGREFRTVATVPDQATANLHEIVEFPV